MASDSPLRILIVDDNQDAAELLADIMTFRGHSVRVAFGGQAALQIVLTFAPRLAILDIGMPEMSGLELARKLRAVPGLGPLSLVALTGWGTPSDRQKTADAGFNYHLTKPVDWTELNKVIATLS